MDKSARLAQGSLSPQPVKRELFAYDQHKPMTSKHAEMIQKAAKNSQLPQEVHHVADPPQQPTFFKFQSTPNPMQPDPNPLTPSKRVTKLKNPAPNIGYTPTIIARNQIQPRPVEPEQQDQPSQLNPIFNRLKNQAMEKTAKFGGQESTRRLVTEEPSDDRTRPDQQSAVAESDGRINSRIELSSMPRRQNTIDTDLSPKHKRAQEKAKPRVFSERPKKMSSLAIESHNSQQPARVFLRQNVQNSEAVARQGQKNDKAREEVLIGAGVINEYQNQSIPR